MVFAVLVVALAQMNALFRRARQAQHHIQINAAMVGRHNLHLRWNVFAHQGFHRCAVSGAGGVQLGQHHQVGRNQLVFKQLVQWRFVVQVRVLLALRVHSSRVGGKLAGSSGGHIYHGHHRIHGAGVFDLGPVEGLHQGLGQRQAAGLDQDVVDLVAALDQLAHHRVKLLLHRAAHAAIGQLVQLAGLLARLVFAANATAAQNVAVNAQLAKLVDDDRNAPALGVGQNVAQQRGFATAQKTGDDGGRDFLATVHGNTP